MNGTLELVEQGVPERAAGTNHNVARVIELTAPDPKNETIDIDIGKRWAATLHFHQDGQAAGVAHVPVATSKAARAYLWYSRRIAATEEELTTLTDEDAFDELNTKLDALHERRLRLLVPDLPEALYSTLSFPAQNQLTAAAVQGFNDGSEPIAEQPVEDTAAPAEIDVAVPSAE